MYDGLCSGRDPTLRWDTKFSEFVSESPLCSFPSCWGVFLFAVVGDYALLSEGPAGPHFGGAVEVIDISDPTNPRPTGEFVISGSWAGRSPLVADNILYLPQDGGLQLFDVRNLPSVVQIGGWSEFSVQAYAVALSGKYAYVAAGGRGLQVIDVSDPAQPKPAGEYSSGGMAQDVVVVGTTAYIADSTAGLQVIDISNPTTPKLLSEYQTGGSSGDAAVVGDIAFVADGYAGLQVIDLSDPAHPERVGGYNTGGRALGVVVDGSFAYVADGPGGLKVVDISNLERPRLVASVSTNGFVSRATVVRKTVYVAASLGGLEIFDVNDPAAPQRLGGIETSGNALDVAVAGNLAYVADEGEGLQIFDVTDPAKPQRLAGIKTRWRANRVKVVNNLAYVADFWSGFDVIDVQDPRNPERLGRYEAADFGAGLIEDLTVVGDLLYLGSIGPQSGPGYMGQGVRIFDVRDPRQPRLVGANSELWAFSVVVANGKLYVTTGSTGLTVFEFPAFATMPELRPEGLQLEWNRAASGMTLQRAKSLSQPFWETVQGSEVTNRLVLPIQDSKNEFFRLISR